MIQLTENMIKMAFDELAINEEFFEIFKEEVERLYSESQIDSLDNEEFSGEESYANIICFSIKFMEYYVPEKKKGHCEAWAETYANSRLSRMKEYSSYRNAYYAVKNDEEKENELDIHVASMSDDPLFRKRYKFLFTEISGDPKEYAESYCNNYRGMIASGKSEIFAHAYADYHDEHDNKYFCVIYAKAYELAKSYGMNDRDAFYFGDISTEAVDQGVWSFTNEFLKRYHEKWQKDFYFTLIKNDFEESEHRKMSRAEEEKFMKELFD